MAEVYAEGCEVICSGCGRKMAFLPSTLNSNIQQPFTIKTFERCGTAALKIREFSEIHKSCVSPKVSYLSNGEKCIDKRVIQNSQA